MVVSHGMPEETARLTRPLVVALLLLAAVKAVVPTLHMAVKPGRPGDFGSYYFAARVLGEGGNPYDLDRLNELAVREIHHRVNPYLYPPPFLLLVMPFSRLPFHPARIAWFFLELLGLAACLILLHRIVGESSRLILLFIAFCGLTYPALYENLLMGQANFLVFLLMLLGIAELIESRDLSAGALLGAAAILKMSPAILLLYLVCRRRFRAVAAAVGSALLLSILSLAAVPAAWQIFFYAKLLPSFSRRFPLVHLRVDWIGNHSLPALAASLFPSSSPLVLSGTARIASLLLELLILALLVYLVTRGGGARTSLLTGISLFTIPMVAFPVFAYEHHLLYLLLPLSVGVSAAMRGAVPRRCGPLLGVAYGLLAIPPAQLALASRSLGAGRRLVSQVKLSGIFLLCLVVGLLLLSESREAQGETS